MARLAQVCPAADACPIPCCAAELADLLELSPRSLAMHILPAVLPKLCDLEDEKALGVLAAATGLSPSDLMHQYGPDTVSRYLYQGHQAFQRLPYDLRHPL